MGHYEKQISTERIYEGKIINLRRDTVELENGSTAAREVVEHNGGVCVLAVDEQDCIYFVRQYRYAMGKVLLELPAGKLEKGEDPAACGMRELMEECGCKARTFLPLATLYPTCAYVTEVIHVFFASDLSAVPQKLDEDEFLDVEKIPAEKALQMVLDGEIPDAKTQVGLLKWKALRDAGRI